MLVLLLACADDFPCDSAQLLDASGACVDGKAAPGEDSAAGGGGGGGGDTDTGTADTDTGAGDTDTGPADTDTSPGDSDTGPLPPADDGWPAVFAAPYVDATGYPTVKVGELPAENGVDHYTLAFIVSGGSCEATWGGYSSVDDGPSAWDDSGEYTLYDQIDTLRAAGGDVMVSFGGAAGTPIESACTSASDVLVQFERVVDRLSLTRIDFDVEGAWQLDDASLRRREEALVELEAERSVHVWFTVPVLPSGLTAEALAVVTDALDAGVRIDGLNLMTMDYGDSAAPSPDGQMGEYGIAAVEAVHDQLSARFDEGYAWLGTTPMIGQNDTSTEFFDVEDLQETRDFAEEAGLGMLSFWSISRDTPCAEETPWASSTCNGSADIPTWAFSAIEAGYGE